MKLGAVTKLHKGNTAILKKLDNDFHVSKLCRHCFFYNLWSIRNHLGAGFRTHGLSFIVLLFHQW